MTTDDLMALLPNEDLPAELKRPDPAIEKMWKEPGTCPSCGITEPNGLLLSNNHGVDPVTKGIGGFPPGKHPIYGARCVAQSLKQNHIIYGIRRGMDISRDVAEALKLNMDVETIITEAVAELPTLCVECLHNPRTDGDYCSTCTTRAERSNTS